MNTENGSARTALVLYGSETGNAQEVAEELGRTAERLRFVTHVGECNGVKAVSVALLLSHNGIIILTICKDSLASYSLVIFVVSTTGQGDFPLNGRAFWRTLLLKRLSPTFLSGVQCTQFGLGDSSYPKYVPVPRLSCLSVILRIITGSIGLRVNFIGALLSSVPLRFIQAEKATNNIRKGECVMVLNYV
jgi:sulfite reductase alpha subunit-like flavoprotein